MKKSSTLPIFASISEHFPDAYSQAMKQFFTDVEHHSLDVDPETSISYVANWFVFTYILPNGKTPLLTYIEDNPDHLSKRRLAIYTVVHDTVHFDLFETRKIRFNRGLTIIGLSNQQAYEVREKRGTHGAMVGQISPNWVFKVGNHWELASSTVALQPEMRESMRIFFSDNTPPSPRDIYIALTKHRTDDAQKPREALGQFWQKYGKDVSCDDVIDQLKMHGIEKLTLVLEYCLEHMMDCPKTEYYRFIELLSELWNDELRQTDEHTEELSDWTPGPVENALITQLQQVAYKKFDPEKYDDLDVLNRQLAIFQKQWIDTPQFALDGRCPREVVATERRQIDIHPDHDWTVQLSISSLPSNDDARKKELFYQGVEEMHIGNFDCAVATFKTLTAEMPDDFQGWGNLGIALAALNKKEEAINALETALILHPDYTLAQRNLEVIKKTPEEELSSVFTTGGIVGSVLATGIDEGAYNAWRLHITDAQANRTSIVRDAIIFLQWCMENKGHRLTPKQKLLPKKVLYALNDQMSIPEVVEHTFTSSHTGEKICSTKTNEHQFPVIRLVRHLLEAMELLTVRRGRLCPTKAAEEWLNLPPHMQWCSLLWSFFIDLSWGHIVNDYHKSIAEKFQKEHVEWSIGRLLDRQDEEGGEWFEVNPMTATRWDEEFSEEGAEEDVADEEALHMQAFIMALSEVNYLWHPLELFGLLKSRSDEIIPGTGLEEMEFVKITPLGEKILPTLTQRRHDEAGIRSTAQRITKHNLLQKAGRNDPCPCGATKENGSPIKYKKCCG